MIALVWNPRIPRQSDLCEFKASLICIGSSRSTRAIKCESVSQEKEEEEKGHSMVGHA